MTSSTSKIFFLGQFVAVFSNLMSKLTYYENVETLKIAAILRFGRSFKPEVVPEIESYTKIAPLISYIMSF